VSVDGAYANLVLPRLVADAGLDSRDASLATELGYGTVRATGTLDEILRQCSSRDLADIDGAVLDVLRLGAYQLLRTRVPAHAAVATTVDLARATGNARAAGFVNAVLRKVGARDFDAWCDRIGRDASPAGKLALRYCHPGWIVGAFADALGGEHVAEEPPAEEPPDEELAGEELAGEELAGEEFDELEAALAADDARPETHLVAWPGRLERSALIEQAGGIATPFSPYGVRLSEGGDPASVAAIREHRAGVQDEGSQLCALALTRLEITGPDTRWLDLCAGPGGKAAMLAALASTRGAQLTANELHPHRAKLVAQVTEGWDVRIDIGDARELADEQGYDRILLDAPCSGLGALRRRPEARWRRGPDDLAELIVLQTELIDAAVRLLRPGGVLGYVTCSPHLAETIQQVHAALDRHPDLRLVDARPAFAEVSGLTDTPTVQLWPHRQGTDAMFFAGLRRVESP
jgi:16S rRNA (cytosine967-C5)-methyltransferase